jgi:hypothetical protein
MADDKITDAAVGAATIGCGLFAVLSGICSALVPIILVAMVIMAIVRGC